VQTFVIDFCTGLDVHEIRVVLAVLFFKQRVSILVLKCAIQKCMDNTLCPTNKTAKIERYSSFIHIRIKTSWQIANIHLWNTQNLD